MDKQMRSKRDTETPNLLIIEGKTTILGWGQGELLVFKNPKLRETKVLNRHSIWLTKSTNTIKQIKSKTADFHMPH